MARTGSGGVEYHRQAFRGPREGTVAMKNLAVSEATLRMAFEAIQDGILAVDAGDLRLVAANAAMCRMLGYDREELLALSVREIHPPEDLPALTEHFGRMVRPGSGSSNIRRLVRKNGSLFEAEINGVTVELGGRTCLLGVFRDITDRKRAEEELRRQSDFAASLVETVQTVVLVLDPEGRIVQFNPYLERISGHRLADVRGRDWFATFLPAGRADASRELGDAIRPSVLDDFGLDAAIRAYGDRFTARTGLALRHRTGVVSGLRLAREAEIALFRIVQEALANAARHAKATEVVVSMDAIPGRFRLEVADNGAGFDPETPRDAGWNASFGIQIMARRAEAVGGSFRVESRPGQGTSVIVEVPR